MFLLMNKIMIRILIAAVGEGCSHILSCLSSTTESVPVMLRHSAMNDLEIRETLMHIKLWVYATPQ